MGYFDRLGAILRVGASEVSNANPVPVSDAGGAITVDGTVAVTNADIATLAGAVSGGHMQTDVLTSPGLTDTELRASAVPVSGTVTANLSATDNAVLDAIAAKDFATQATLASVQTAIAILTGAVSATHMQVDVLTSPGLTDTQLRATAVPVTLGTEGLPALSSVTDSIIAMLSPVDNAVLDVIASAVDGGHMQVDIVSGAVSGGTAAVDDADFTAASTSGTPAMGVYESTPSSVTNGDLGVVGITQSRALRTVLDADGLPALASQTDSISALLLAGTATVGTVLAVGTVADDATTPGAPVMVGGSAVAIDGTDPTAVAENDVARFRTDLNRRVLVSDIHPRLGTVNHEETSAQTNHELIAAPGAGLSIYITDIVVSNGATAGTVKFVESTASSPVIKVPAMFLGINGGAVMNFKTPIRITANTNFGLTSATVTTHSVLVNYFIAP